MVASRNIIWIDEKIENLENQIYLQKLKSIVYSNIETFKDINLAIDRIKKIKFEETIIIVSGILYVPFIEEFKRNINAIYIIPKIIIFLGLGNKEIFKSTVTIGYINDQFYNSGGIHDNFQEIVDYILSSFGTNKIMIKRVDDDSELTFDYINSKEDLALPMFYKSLIKITPKDKDNIEKFTQHLYHKYSQENEKLKNLLEPIITMKNIPTELLSKYYSRAYTAESSFYNDLNSNLRGNNREVYMPFIKVLYEGIKHKTLSLASDKELFRGGRIDNNELEKIKARLRDKKSDLPVSIVFSKAFLSFTKDEKTANDFLNKNTTQEGFSKVLYKLKKDDNMDYTLSSHADMEKLSFFPEEKEVLFFPFSSFAIENCKETDFQGEKGYIIDLIYLGKYAKDFQLNQIHPQNTTIPISPGIVQSQKPITPISPGIIQTQIPHTPIHPGLIQSQMPSTPISPGIIQNQIPLTPIQSQIPSLKASTISSNLENLPNLMANFPKSNFKELFFDSGLVKKELKQIKVENLVNEFNKDKEEIKKIKTMKTITKEEEVNPFIKNYEKTYAIRIIKNEEKPISKVNTSNGANQGYPNNGINQGYPNNGINQVNPNNETNKVIAKIPSSFNNSKENNFIIAEVNIDPIYSNKFIRVINSFEEFRRGNLTLRVDNEMRFENEEDIKDCNIEIDGKKVDFFYCYPFSPGKHEIKYTFPYIMTKTDYMFADCPFLKNIDFTNFDSRLLNNTSCMFYGCSSLKGLYLTNFLTKNVNDMSNMFNGCESLEDLDVSYFNTQNVYNMSRMFFGCRSLKKLNASNFNTQKVNNMYSMFAGCKDLENLNISSFDTRNVKNMSRMFSGCSSLKFLNISNFSTINVLYMSNLFNGNSALKSLNISNFNTQNVVNMDDMFQGCTSLLPRNIITNAPVIRKVNYYGY